MKQSTQSYTESSGQEHDLIPEEKLVLLLYILLSFEGMNLLILVSGSH